MRVLDENLLASMAHNPAALAAFPFLRGALREIEEKCCGGKIIRRSVPDYVKMKAAVAALSPAQRNEFLRLAGLRAMRIVWREGKNVKDDVARLQG